MRRSRNQPAQHTIAVPENKVYINDKFFKKIGFTWVGKDVLVDVYSQGTCGCCWACVGTVAITVIHAIKHKEFIPLSKQQLLNCFLVHYPDYKLEETLGKKACFPTSTRNVYRYAMEYGIVEESKCPFKMQRNDCIPPPSDARTVFIKSFDKYDLEKTKMNEIEDRIRLQPITCTILAYDSFQKHTGKGTYMGPTEEEKKEEAGTGEKPTRHAVLIVGFGEDENKEEIYLIQNTWGKKWGYKGFAKIKRSLAFNLAFPLLEDEPGVPS